MSIFAFGIIIGLVAVLFSVFVTIKGLQLISLGEKIREASKRRQKGGAPIQSEYGKYDLQNNLANTVADQQYADRRCPYHDRKKDRPQIDI